MISHGENCCKCRGKMSAPKPVTEGPKAGWTRVFCVKCGHLEFLPAPVTPQPEEELSEPDAGEMV